MSRLCNVEWSMVSTRDSFISDSSAVQGEADGHIAVISLGNKENSLKTSRKQEGSLQREWMELHSVCSGALDKGKAEVREDKILKNKYTVV